MTQHEQVTTAHVSEVCTLHGRGTIRRKTCLDKVLGGMMVGEKKAGKLVYPNYLQPLTHFPRPHLIRTLKSKSITEGHGQHLRAVGGQAAASPSRQRLCAVPAPCPPPPPGAAGSRTPSRQSRWGRPVPGRPALRVRP